MADSRRSAHVAVFLQDEPSRRAQRLINIKHPPIFIKHPPIFVKNESGNNPSRSLFSRAAELFYFANAAGR
jgi:hypothetical protein